MPREGRMEPANMIALCSGKVGPKNTAHQSAMSKETIDQSKSAPFGFGWCGSIVDLVV